MSLVNDCLEDTINKYKQLGYKVPGIDIVAIDSYKYNKTEPIALFTEPGDTVIYIDYTALNDLKNNKEALMFYLPHEVAHIVSNENHNGSKFKEMISNWNKHYNKISDLGENEDQDVYAKKYIPNFYKKDSWFDKQTDPKKAEIGLLNGSWRTFTECFNY